MEEVKAMYTYSIYWLTEEVAIRYFHKSGLLYRFLKEYIKQPNRIDLRKQFEYITYRFCREEIVAYMKQQKRINCIDYIDKRNMKLYNREAFITLHIDERQLKFRCETLEDAEELLFPLLRRYEPMLFIVGENICNFGWITPFLKYRQTEEEVLFSFR
jgi:hypothetical protein